MCLEVFHRFFELGRIVSEYIGKGCYIIVDILKSK